MSYGRLVNGKKLHRSLKVEEEKESAQNDEMLVEVRVLRFFEALVLEAISLHLAS